MVDGRREFCSRSSRSPTVGLVSVSPRMMRSTSFASSVSYFINCFCQSLDPVPLAFQQSSGFIVKTVDQFLHFFINRASGLVAVFTLIAKPAERVWLVVIFTVENKSEAITHAPFGNHPASHGSRLLDIAAHAAVGIAGKHFFGDSTTEGRFD